MAKCTRCGGTGEEPENRYDGQELKRLRMNSGMTQEALADMIGCTQSYISQIERGKIKVPEDIKQQYIGYFVD